jgi:hypothetical protein
VSSRLPRLDRVALFVGDLDHAVSDLEQLLEIDMPVTGEPGQRSAVSNAGYELIEAGDDPTTEATFPLRAVVVRVANVDDVCQRMAGLGIEVEEELTGPDGVREVSFGCNFNGIPLIVRGDRA